MYLCDVTSSRNIWVHHYEFHLYVSLGPLASFRGEEGELPGAECYILYAPYAPWPLYSPSFLGLPPLLLAQGA